MPSSAWSVYNEAKKYIMNGTVDLDTATLKMRLYGSASNVASLSISTFASINTPASGGGYNQNGKTIASVSVTSIASAKSYSLECTTVIFSAVGSTITKVKYAAIGISGGKAICYCKLTGTQTTVTAGNTISVIPATNGIFAVA